MPLLIVCGSCGKTIKLVTEYTRTYGVATSVRQLVGGDCCPICGARLDFANYEIEVEEVKWSGS